MLRAANYHHERCILWKVSCCLWSSLMTGIWPVFLEVSSNQGCVRGQHGRGQGQRSSRPRPRPQNFVLEIEASPWGPPFLGFFFTAQRYAESGYATSSICPSLKFNALLPPLVRLCMNYEVLYLWYWVLYLPYSKIQRLTARSRSQSQGRASSRPRPRPGVFEAKAKATKFCPRAVLEVEASPRGPHPCK